MYIYFLKWYIHKLVSSCLYIVNAYTLFKNFLVHLKGRDDQVEEFMRPLVSLHE